LGWKQMNSIFQIETACSSNRVKRLECGGRAKRRHRFFDVSRAAGLKPALPVSKAPSTLSLCRRTPNASRS